MSALVPAVSGVVPRLLDAYSPVYEPTDIRGEPEERYEHTTCAKTLMLSTAPEGEGPHYQLGARRLAFGRIHDSLDKTFGSI